MSFVKFCLVMLYLMFNMGEPLPKNADFDVYFNHLYEVVEEVNHHTDQIDRALEKVEQIFPFID